MKNLLKEAWDLLTSTYRADKLRRELLLHAQLQGEARVAAEAREAMEKVGRQIKEMRRQAKKVAAEVDRLVREEA